MAPKPKDKDTIQGSKSTSSPQPSGPSQKQAKEQEPSKVTEASKPAAEQTEGPADQKPARVFKKIGRPPDRGVDLTGLENALMAKLSGQSAKPVKKDVDQWQKTVEDNAKATKDTEDIMAQLMAATKRRASVELPVRSPESDSGRISVASSAKGEREEKVMSADHIEFLNRIGYAKIRDHAFFKLVWTETNDGHRQQRYLGILMNSRALTWSQSLNSSILILNCYEPTDGPESPMSAYANNQVEIQQYTGSLTVNFWEYGNSNFTAQEIVVWLIGQIVENIQNDNFMFPTEDTALDLFEIFEKIILMQLRVTQMVVVLDGLALFERSIKGETVKEKWRNAVEVSEKAGPSKKAEIDKQKGVSKPTPTKKPESKTAQHGQKLEPSKSPESSKKPKPVKKSEPSKKAEPGKSEKVEADESVEAAPKGDKGKKAVYKADEEDAQLASDTLRTLVNTLIGIADQNLGLGHYLLKLLFINPIRSQVMSAAEEAHPEIPVVDVPTVKEFGELYPHGFALPGPRGSQIRP